MSSTPPEKNSRFVPAEYQGWRAFGLYEHSAPIMTEAWIRDGYEPPRPEFPFSLRSLRGPTFNHHNSILVWPNDNYFEAICVKHTGKDGAPPPAAPGCSCGVHGVLTRMGVFSQHDSSARLIGRIAAAGRVVKATDGFRAQKARVLALEIAEDFVFSTPLHLYSADDVAWVLGTQYKVPVDILPSNQFGSDHRRAVRGHQVFTINVINEHGNLLAKFVSQSNTKTVSTLHTVNGRFEVHVLNEFQVPVITTSLIESKGGDVDISYTSPPGELGVFVGETVHIYHSQPPIKNAVDAFKNKYQSDFSNLSGRTGNAVSNARQSYNRFKDQSQGGW